MKRAILLLALLTGCAAFKGQYPLDEPGGVTFKQYPVHGYGNTARSMADLNNHTDRAIEADVICSLFEYRGIVVPPHTGQGFVFVDDQTCTLESWRVLPSTQRKLPGPK